MLYEKLLYIMNDFKGIIIYIVYIFFNKWKRFRDLKINFVFFLNGMLYFFVPQLKSMFNFAYKCSTIYWPKSNR